MTVRLLLGDCRDVLIDLDPRNMPMAQERIAGEAPLFADVEVA